MKAFLDTHVLVYWLQGDERLLPRQSEVLEAASPDEPLWVSDITLWEIAMLVSLGRLSVDRPLRDWLEAAVAPPLVRRVSVSPSVAAEVASLPADFHKDPADRIIVASARTVAARLLTLDERIIRSGCVPTL